MSFLFCAPKEENEVEKEDREIFFSAFKGKDEESFWDEELYKWSKRREATSV